MLKALANEEYGLLGGGRVAKCNKVICGKGTTFTSELSQYMKGIQYHKFKFPNAVFHANKAQIQRSDDIE